MEASGVTDMFICKVCFIFRHHMIPGIEGPVVFFLTDLLSIMHIPHILQNLMNNDNIKGISRDVCLSANSSLQKTY